MKSCNVGEIVARSHAGNGDDDKWRDLRHVFKIGLITFANDLDVQCMGEGSVMKTPYCWGLPNSLASAALHPSLLYNHASPSFHHSAFMACSLNGCASPRSMTLFHSVFISALWECSFTL